MGLIKDSDNILIFDNFLSPDNLIKFQKQIKEISNIKETWFDINSNHTHSCLCNLVLNKISDYYDLKSCIGYEFWTQKNTRPKKWHYDKDEKFYRERKIFRFPICSSVFYLEVKNLNGGNLLVEEKTIQPITNRLVIFSPGMFHYVQEFTGTRISTLINPWNIKI